MAAPAKRPRDEEEDESAYPFVLALDKDTDQYRTRVYDMTQALLARFCTDNHFFVSNEDMAASSSPVRLPYLFALPREASATTTTHEMNWDDGSMTTVAGFKVLLLGQQAFMKAYMPKNTTLIRLWKSTFAAVHALRDRKDERAVVLHWADSGYEKMRAGLREHPLAGQLTDLVSMIPLVAEGVAADDAERKANRDGYRRDIATLPRGPERDAAIRSLRYGSWAGTWRLYERFFMPGPDRVGVALPVGLVLFEGRASDTDPTEMLERRVRRAPFSTTWHVNVGVNFANRKKDEGDHVNDAVRSRDSCLFAHKVMSDGIVGVDVQVFRGSLWRECEIIVQPLVSFHLVDEVIVAIERFTDASKRNERTYDCYRNVAQRVLFTHAFLGDTCPCEARAAAENNSSSSKQQRTHGRAKPV